MYSRLPVPLVFRQSHDTDSHELDTYGSGPVVWSHPGGVDRMRSSRFNSEFMQYFEILCVKL